MKPAPFDYVAATSADDAVRLLAEHGDEALILAGGQSLVPMMNMRLARPTVLIDINDCDEMKFMTANEGGFAIGAGTRQKDILKSAETRAAVPLLLKALAFVGHVQTRNRGTLGGSIAHGDPSAEMPLVAVTLDGSLTAQSTRGRRVIKATDFLDGIMTTTLEEDELLVEARLPLPAADTRFGFVEFSRRQGDFALAMALVSFRLTDGVISDARLGIGGAEDCPRRIPQAEAALEGQPPGNDAFTAAAAAVAEALDPMEDYGTSAQYRRELAQALARRALESAA